MDGAPKIAGTRGAARRQLSEWREFVRHNMNKHKIKQELDAMIRNFRKPAHDAKSGDREEDEENKEDEGFDDIMLSLECDPRDK